MPFYVYLLECCDKSLYCGSTKNLEKRLALHGRGKASKYTRSKLPVKLVFSEAKKTRREAMKREAEIKKLSRRAKLKLVQSRQK